MSDSHISTLFQGKTVVGYGAGLAAMMTLRTAGIRFSFLVDEQTALHDQKLAGVPIRPPRALAELDPAATMVVVLLYNPKSILAAQARLEKLGFFYFRNWIDCSLLHYETMAPRVREHFALSPDPELFRKVRALTLRGGVENQSGIAGTWLFLELANKTIRSIDGSIAELGVYKGGNAFTALLLGDRGMEKRSYHLFDSFAGFPALSEFDPASRGAEFGDVSVEWIRSVFAEFANAKLHVGMFRETLSSVADEKFSLVYVDCDLYEPALECCEFFYPRLQPGGFLMLHDYCDPGIEFPQGSKPPFLGIHRAVHEFLAQRTARITVFPETTHAVIHKQ